MWYMFYSTQICLRALGFLVQKQPLATLEKRKWRPRGPETLQRRHLEMCEDTSSTPRSREEWKELPACRTRRRPRVAWLSQTLR